MTLESALRWAADLFVPRACPGCGRSLPPAAPEEFCAACMASLPVLLEPWCVRCGESFQAGPGSPGFACARCRAEAPPFAVARAAFRFEGPVREAVHALKFRGDRRAAVPLGGLLAAGLRDRAEVLGGAPVVIAVPLHPDRKRARGWDQAELIGAAAAAAWVLPFVPGALRRTRLTPPQVGLDRPDRQRNMAGAFEPGSAAGDLRGRTAILVDDVLTTGATVAAATRAALAAGVTEVRVAAVARD